MIGVTPSDFPSRLKLNPQPYEIIHNFVKELISRGNLEMCLSVLSSGVVTDDACVELGLEIAYNIDTKENYIKGLGQILQVKNLILFSRFTVL